MRSGYVEFEEGEAKLADLPASLRLYRSDKPISICFLTPRLLAKQLVIPKAVYERRLQRLREQAESIVHYMEEPHTCRSQLLLRYFGERHSPRCGQCDHCLPVSEELTSSEFEEIRAALQTALGSEPQSVYYLLDRLPFERGKSIQAIRFLTNEDPCFLLQDGFLSYVRR